MEAIILAGGLGTRLQKVVSDVPKPMAPVGGRPFLEHLVNQLVKFRAKKIVLSIGHKADVITEYFDKHRHNDIIEFCNEPEPLGTGGAVEFSLKKTSDKNVLIINGDTYLDLDIGALFQFHVLKDADFTVAIKTMRNCDRYDNIVLDKDDRIVKFLPRKFNETCLINAGYYIIERNLLKEMPDKFSIEKDFILPQLANLKFYGFRSNGYFIDIGIPEDYERAQKELKT